MKKINLVFAVHNHQPIGNFDAVIEEAYQRSYKPFIEVLERHPSVKLTQHWTGPLIAWIADHHFDLIERMIAMVQRGQLEILTGAYYESILAVIPESDRVGQIKKLSSTIEDIFGTVPRGMWLAERVWEQPIVRSIAAAGVGFVAIDDTHFRHAGLRDEQLLGHYITEEQGATVRVLPIDKTLRYTVPFRDLQETLRYLQHVASDDGQRVVVHADDGEKFGVWPRTYKHVYEDQWLELFCQMLEREHGWITTMHMEEVVTATRPQGRIYLPTASYVEMMKWALDPTSYMHLEEFERDVKARGEFERNAMYIRGGYWRNFFAKYPEANHMHKKMLRVSERLQASPVKGKALRDIQDLLWAGQCNDAYWHGVFGGLYLPNLRFPVYRSLIAAEAKIDAAEKTEGVKTSELDFDCDGAHEILVESPVLTLYLAPATGGHLIELDYKPGTFNLLDILSRREEGYHRRMLAEGVGAHNGLEAKEEGLEQHLHFDWYRHASLVDHFLGEGTTLLAFNQSKYLELGDFVDQPYQYAFSNGRKKADITMSRDGALWFGARPHRLRIEKNLRYIANAEMYEVDYTLRNAETAPVDVTFAVEFNVGLMAGDAHDRFYYIEGRTLDDRRLRSRGEESDVQAIELVDEWLGLRTTISTSVPALCWRMPIETVSLSEGGLERLFQSSLILFQWTVTLRDTFHVTVRQSVERLPSR